MPSELIAQRPCEPRDASRLLVLHRSTGKMEHRVFRDLPSYLRPNDCLVLNRTRVLPAKFVAHRATGGRIEGLFIRETGPGRWRVMLNGVRRIRQDERLRLGDSPWSLVLVERGERGLCEVSLDPPDPAVVVLGVVGATPLPPYIHRDSGDAGSLEKLDQSRYQTVYAEVAGAVAAPTAGLHFTSDLFRRIQSGGASVADLVLHVGLGTFQPIEVVDLADHPMHSEWYDVPGSSVDTICKARSAQGRIMAVGTTTVRALETCARGGELLAWSGWTDIMIAPPFTFRVTDMLLTNFHLPGSTLLALIFAFAGRDLILRAYQTAIEERYRFYSYGDAMLII